MPFGDYVALEVWTPAATWFVVAGVLTASLILAAEFRFGRVLQQRVTAALSVGWALLAIAVYFTTYDWLSTAAVASWSVFTLAALAPQQAWFQRALCWSLQPAVVWIGMLMLCVQGAIAIPRLSVKPVISLDGIDSAYAGYRVLSGIVAITDTGREIPLTVYEVSPTATTAETELLASESFAAQVIRLFPPNPECNCHGWVFTGGRHAIASQHVAGLLADNKYAPVDQPSAGDIVIYRAGDSVTHTGLVKWVGERGEVFIESKWGPLGVYLHAVEAQPYGSEFTYYRTSRPNHLVVIRTEPVVGPAGSNFVRQKLDSTEQPVETLSDESIPAADRKPHQRPIVHPEGAGRT